MIAIMNSSIVTNKSGKKFREDYSVIKIDFKMIKDKMSGHKIGYKMKVIQETIL